MKTGKTQVTVVGAPFDEDTIERLRHASEREGVTQTRICELAVEWLVDQLKEGNNVLPYGHLLFPIKPKTGRKLFRIDTQVYNLLKGLEAGRGFHPARTFFTAVIIYLSRQQET